MELDDLDEAGPVSTDELTSSTTFMEERTTAAPPPPPPVSSLYDEEEVNIPTESNPVSYSYFLSRNFFYL
jgi:hypothetical protein